MIKGIFVFFFMALLITVQVELYAETVGKIAVPPGTPDKLTPPVSDSDILDKAERAIAASKLLSTLPIGVTVSNGYVTLTGTVFVQAQADEAIKIAKSIYGVKDVTSTITVKPTPRVFINPTR